jgi:hypothetical protein
MSWTIQTPFWTLGHLKELRPNACTGDEYSDRLSKNETKISISGDEKKAVIIN